MTPAGRTALATLHGVEACRRVMARRTDQPIKLDAPPYDVHEGTYAVRTAEAPPQSWVLLRPDSLGVTIALQHQAAAPVDVAEWHADYPTRALPDQNAPAALEDLVDVPAILSPFYREQLTDLVDQALAVLPGRTPAQVTGHA